MVQNTAFVCDFSSLVMLCNIEFIGDIRYFNVVIVWSSFTCFSVIYYFDFQLFSVSCKNSSSFNNWMSILPESHNDHCFVMQCFEIIVLLVEI